MPQMRLHFLQGMSGLQKMGGNGMAQTVAVAFRRRQLGVLCVQAEESINTLATDWTRVPRWKEVGQGVTPRV